MNRQLTESERWTILNALADYGNNIRRDITKNAFYTESLTSQLKQQIVDIQAVYDALEQAETITLGDHP